MCLTGTKARFLLGSVRQPAVAEGNSRSRNIAILNQKVTHIFHIADAGAVDNNFPFTAVFLNRFSDFRITNSIIFHKCFLEGQIRTFELADMYNRIFHMQTFHDIWNIIRHNSCAESSNDGRIG